MSTLQYPSDFQTPQPAFDPKYQKIGGWLYLVAIGVVLNPFLTLFLFMTNFGPLFTDNTWSILTTPGTQAYHPLWAPLLIFEILGNLAVLAVSVIVAVFFFQRRKSLPRLFITFLLANLAFLVLDFFFANQIPFIASMDNSETIATIIRTTVYTLIWVPYFLFSERVKGTFVN